MRGEDIFEEGIVTAAAGGSATVAILKSDACDDCSAKIFCGAGESENTVEVSDTFGVQVGDSVRILIRGESLFAAAGILYGIPLLLILAGILVGTYVYDPAVMPGELWSMLLGIGLAAIYYLIVFLKSPSLKLNPLMPSIVSVNKRIDD